MLYRPGSSASSLSHTFFFSLSLSFFRSLPFSPSCCVYYYYLLLFPREEFSFVYFWAVLFLLSLSLFLSSFFFIVNTSIRTFSLFHSLIKIFIHTVELSRLASISFCHLSVVNIIPKVTSWKPISLTLNCSSLVNNLVFSLLSCMMCTLCLSLCVCMCTWECTCCRHVALTEPY